MKQPKKHKRWFHIDPQSGHKVIRKFDIDVTPPPPWQRGTGPHAPEVLAKVQAHIARTFKGVPKPAEQKRKMSEAALGKKKSTQHRANMRKRWKTERVAKVNKVKEAYAQIQSDAWET